MQQQLLGFKLLNGQYTTVNRDVLSVTPGFIKLHKQYLIPLDEQNG